MCRVVGSTEPLRQSIVPLTDSSLLGRPAAGSQLQAFPAHLLPTSAFQSPLQTFLLPRPLYGHLAFICACFYPRYRCSREVVVVVGKTGTHQPAPFTLGRVLGGAVTRTAQHRQHKQVFHMGAITRVTSFLTY